MTYLHTYLLTYLLTNWLTDWLTYLLTDKAKFRKKTLRKNLVRAIRSFTHKADARRRSRRGTVHLSSKEQVDLRPWGQIWRPQAAFLPILLFTFNCSEFSSKSCLTVVIRVQPGLWTGEVAKAFPIEMMPVFHTNRFEKYERNTISQVLILMLQR